MLSQAAFNAFLKTLEEPPAHAVFILATTEKHKILPTIFPVAKSSTSIGFRCRMQSLTCNTSRSKKGSRRNRKPCTSSRKRRMVLLADALSMFDQLVAFAGKNLTYAAVTEQLHVLDHDTYFELTDFALNSDIPSAMLRFNDVMAAGLTRTISSRVGPSHLRNLMVCRDPQTLNLLEATQEVKARFQEQASRADLFFIVGGLDILNKADVQFRGSQHQRLLVELALMQVCSQEALKKKSTDGSYGLMACGGRKPRSRVPSTWLRQSAAFGSSSDPCHGVSRDFNVPRSLPLLPSRRPRLRCRLRSLHRLQKKKRRFHPPSQPPCLSLQWFTRRVACGRRRRRW